MPICCRKLATYSLRFKIAWNWGVAQSLKQAFSESPKCCIQCKDVLFSCILCRHVSLFFQTMCFPPATLGLPWACLSLKHRGNTRLLRGVWVLPGISRSYHRTSHTAWWWLEHDFYFNPYIGNNHPNWLIFVRGGWNHQPAFYFDAHRHTVTICLYTVHQFTSFLNHIKSCSKPLKISSLVHRLKPISSP